MREGNQGFERFLRQEREKQAEIERREALIEQERQQLEAQPAAVRQKEQERAREYARQQAPYREELARELSKSTLRVARAARRQLRLEWLNGRWIPRDLGWYMSLSHNVENRFDQDNRDNPDRPGFGERDVYAQGEALTTHGEIIRLEANTRDNDYEYRDDEASARQLLRRTDNVREVLPYSEEDLARIHERLAKFCVEKGLDV